MFPYRDDNPTATTPVVTYALVAANVLIFLLVLPWHNEAVWQFGFLPWELFAGARHPESATVGGPTALVTSMFMHGGLMHLAGNMMFLWVFGDNVEDAMGHGRYLAFYLLCGLAAHFLQLVFLWTSAGGPPTAPLPLSVITTGAFDGPEAAWFVPMVGASGAISGVMAAYYRLYPAARVRMLVPIFFFITTIAIPASFAIGYWFLIQIVSGVAASSALGGTAWWAHIGGFVGGLLLLQRFLSPAIRQRMALQRRWKRVHQNLN